MNGNCEPLKLIVDKEGAINATRDEGSVIFYVDLKDMRNPQDKDGIDNLVIVRTAVFRTATPPKELRDAFYYEAITAIDLSWSKAKVRNAIQRHINSQLKAYLPPVPSKQ